MHHHHAQLDAIRRLIRDIPDFPKPGILFKDITPLLGDGEGFAATIALFVERYRDAGLTAVAAIESRGFIFGAPLAQSLGVGLVPVRKRGKLPAEVVGMDYALEYGTDRVEMHADALGEGDRVLLVDDLLATGGTAAAAVALIESTGASVAEVACLIELEFLSGRERLGATPFHAFLRY